MGSSEEWDVEQHKMEHECDEHWELRRKFLIAHRDKFTEDELICLAQVFTNVEFLGCRYPEETMQLIAELSQDVAKDYREKQKTMLQRTFVKASDAASAKVKGLTRLTDNSGTTTNSSVKNCILPSKKCHATTSLAKQPVKKMKLDSGDFGNIVLIEHGDSAPQSIIMNAVIASGGNLDWKYDKGENGCTCKIYINTKFLSEGSGYNQKVAKKEAAITGLNELRKFHYTIKVKKMMDHNNESTISSKMLNTESVEDRISDDNIGMKLMKLMGWSGGGLGKEQQGIAEPITVQQQISRKGFGLQDSSHNILQALQKKCRQTLKEYKTGNMRTDLVFSVDFTNEERAVIHKTAREFGLKSSSYGPKDHRTLIVSRKIDPWELVDELKALGGHTEKYELIDPTNS